jgi:hypothetical protein
LSKIIFEIGKANQKRFLSWRSQHWQSQSEVTILCEKISGNQVVFDHGGFAWMTCGRSPHHGEAMTWSLCDHHPDRARMTCGRSPHQKRSQKSFLSWRSQHWQSQSGIVRTRIIATVVLVIMK